MTTRQAVESIPHVKTSDRLTFRLEEIKKWLDLLPAVEALVRDDPDILRRLEERVSDELLFRRVLRVLQELMRERFPPVEEPPPEGPVSPPPVSPPPAPKPPETRKETPPKEKKKPLEPPTPGRGGAEHQYLQALVKRLGEPKGFRATLEAPAGGGQVDVALEREDKRIAVEIAVTTTPEHELGNIRKCLPEFDEVLVVAGNRSMRGKLARKLEELSEAEQERVEVLSPEEASSYLLSLPEAGGKKVKGYVVRRRYQEAEGADAKARQETVARIVAERLRKMGEGGE